MDEMVPMEEDEAVPMVKNSFGCELGSHCPAASECTTSFEVGSGPDRSTDETFAEVVHDEVDTGYGNLASADCRPHDEQADSKCMSDVWCTHDQVNVGKSRGKSRCRERLGVKRYEHKRDKVEIGRSFQLAVGSHDWSLAESLIPMADVQRLNDGLCITLDSVWFLCTHEELYGATRLIERLVEAGAQDFTRAALRTSFLASCVSACRSRTMSLADTVTVMAQRLRERLQECSGDEMLKAEAAAKVQRFTEWALKCIGSHSRARRKGSGGEEMVTYNSSIESQLQLKAFKRFLELAGNRLSGKDYTEAFDAACFPLTLFSTAIDSGWASGIAASAMQGLLGMLVEGGADNVNQCFLEAARFGSTELVRILMQIAQRNGIEVDVDLALGFASHYCKIGTMECLVNDGNAIAFLGPLMRAADRGCMQVVKWFVERGCRDMELCLALTAAASSSRIEVAEFLLKHIPLHVLRALSLDILKAAGERSAGSLKGIAFLLQSNFLNNPEATYAVADSMSKLEDESISAELKSFFKAEWSDEAFLLGRMVGEAHHLNAMRAIKRGSSPLHIQELPLQLQATIAYFPLYKECASSCGVLLSQWLRGQLVEAALKLNGCKDYSAKEIEDLDKDKLLAIVESRLPSFLVHGS